MAKAPVCGWTLEEVACGRGALRIAGLDEVGRGPLFGPVVAAAVILSRGCRLEGLTDSKKLSAKKRAELDAAIRLNAVAFADIPDYLLSRANTLYNMMQQLTLSLGVACGALALNYSLHWRGSATLEVQDFQPAFIGLTVLCLLSITAFLPMARNAGAAMCGRELQAEEAAHKDPA